MATLASDTFDRADENPLSGGGVWSTANSENPWQIVSNVATPTDLGGTDDGAYYSGIAWPADQYSKAKLTVNGTAGSGTGVGLRVRQASAAQTSYRLIVDHAATNNITIQRFIAGVFSVVSGFPITQAWSDGDTWELRAIGTTLRIFRNGTQVGSDATDTGIASGSPGLALSTAVTSASINDWEGGDFSVPAPSRGVRPMAPQLRMC